MSIETDKRVIIQEQDGDWYIFDKNGVQYDGTTRSASKGLAESMCDAMGLKYKDTGLYVMPITEAYKTKHDQTWNTDWASESIPRDNKDTVYLSITERTDEFAHKRYSSPEVHKYRTVTIRGQKVGEQGNEIMVKLEGNGSFEREGGTYVFSKGNLLSSTPHKDTELGVWKNK